MDMKRNLSVLFFAAMIAFAADAMAQEKYRPAITGPYHVLFKPDRTGDTINDHTVFQDRDGNWRMIGIVSKGLNIPLLYRSYHLGKMRIKGTRGLTEFSMRPCLFTARGQ